MCLLFVLSQSNHAYHGCNPLIYSLETEIFSEPACDYRFALRCSIGTLTTGKELRFAVVVAVNLGGADRALALFYYPTLKLSVFSSLCLLQEPADFNSNALLIATLLTLLLPCVPSEKRSEPCFDPIWLSMSLVLACVFPLLQLDFTLLRSSILTPFALLRSFLQHPFLPHFVMTAQMASKNTKTPMTGIMSSLDKSASFNLSVKDASSSAAAESIS